MVAQVNMAHLLAQPHQNYNSTIVTVIACMSFSIWTTVILLCPSLFVIIDATFYLRRGTFIFFKHHNFEHSWKVPFIFKWLLQDSDHLGFIVPWNYPKNFIWIYYIGLCFCVSVIFKALCETWNLILPAPHCNTNTTSTASLGLLAIRIFS